MRHVIFTKLQRDKVLQKRGSVIERLLEQNIDIDPVELLDGKYCLPVQTLKDLRFKALRDLIIEFDPDNLTTREIDPSEIKGNNADI